MTRRTALADDLAALRGETAAALTDAVAEAVPASARWTTEDRTAVRAAAWKFAAGFVRFLRVGDLEARSAQRLSAVLRAAVPGASDSGPKLAEAVRERAAATILGVLGAGDDPELVRRVERELERYLSALTLAPPRTGDPGDLDAWLARMAADGIIIRPGNAEDDTP